MTDDRELTPMDRVGEDLAGPATHRAPPIRLAVARERMRIARELHDELGALHTAMRLELRALTGMAGARVPDMLGSLQRLDGLLARSLMVRRQLVSDLWPADDGAGARSLDDRLRALCAEYDHAAGLRVQYEVHGSARRLGARLAAAHAVYRVVQESLTNAVAHAGASRVSVSLTVRAGDLRVAIRDDGCGFQGDAAEARGHGLRGMRARVEELGGDWHVVSAPGQGTTVWAVLPLRRPRPVPRLSAAPSAPGAAAAPSRPATRPAPPRSGHPD